MAGDATQTLARFAATLTYDQIPESAREHCKNLLLDAVACALAGHRGEETHQIAAFASALAQSRESAIIGGNPGVMSRGEILLHVVNHTSYHRGFVADLFYQVPARPPRRTPPPRDRSSSRAPASGAADRPTTRHRRRQSGMPQCARHPPTS